LLKGVKILSVGTAPANVHYESIFVHPGEVEVSILGKMVGLVRKS
jgi:SOS-response transcriptional repressor LexA